MEIKYIICDSCRKRIPNYKEISIRVRTYEYSLEVDVCNGKCLDKYIEMKNKKCQTKN